MANTENETTIQFNEGEDKLRIWSCMRTFHTQMERLGVEPTRVGKREGEGFSAWYEVPLSWLHLYPPREKRPLTEEQRKAIGQRLLNARNSSTAIAAAKETDPISQDTDQG